MPVGRVPYVLPIGREYNNFFITLKVKQILVNNHKMWLKMPTGWIHCIWSIKGAIHRPSLTVPFWQEHCTRIKSIAIGPIISQGFYWYAVCISWCFKSYSNYWYKINGPQSICTGALLQILYLHFYTSAQKPNTT